VNKLKREANRVRIYLYTLLSNLNDDRNPATTIQRVILSSQQGPGITLSDVA
jgi:hypothetical protein